MGWQSASWSGRTWVLHESIVHMPMPWSQKWQIPHLMTKLWAKRVGEIQKMVLNGFYISVDGENDIQYYGFFFLNSHWILRFPFFFYRQAHIILHMKWHPCDCFVSRSPRITCVWKMSRGRWTSWWWTRTGSRLEGIQDCSCLCKSASQILFELI